MFGRATITLGIGPHSSYYCFYERSRLPECSNSPLVADNIRGFKQTLERLDLGTAYLK